MPATNGDTSPVPRPESPTGSPRGSVGTSLQAAATMNAGLQQESSRRSSGSFSMNRQSPSHSRRRSTVLMNLQHNDPSLPAPGEMVADNHNGSGSISGAPQATSPLPMSASPHLIPSTSGDPHHNRTPSLGELHQELEAEQEAQVNRLLQTIRQQQLQLQNLQGGQGSSTAIDDSSAISERSNHGTPASQQDSITSGSYVPLQHSGSFSRSPVAHRPRSSFDMARADLQRRSRTPSRGAGSPRLRSTSISGDSDQLGLGGRDESAFFQAETQMLVRENQMLRHRIRDLERQLVADNSTGGAQAHLNEPASHSHLTRVASVDDGGEKPAAAETAASAVEVTPAADTA